MRPWLASFKAQHKTALRSYQTWAKDQHALLSLGPILTIVGAVLSLVVAILVLARLAPTLFTAIGDITSALTNASALNNSVAIAVAAILAIVVPLALLFAFVALIFKAIHQVD